MSHLRVTRTRSGTPVIWKVVKLESIGRSYQMNKKLVLKIICIDIYNVTIPMKLQTRYLYR